VKQPVKRRAFTRSRSHALEDLRSVALKPRSAVLDWLDGLFAVVVFATAMLLYVRTLATTLLLGDSGEYQVLYSTLGLAHPTGYAVLIPLAKLITLLVPVGDAAYRGNLVSAIFAGLALALLYLLGRLLSGSRLAPLVGVTAMGLYRLFLVARRHRRIVHGRDGHDCAGAFAGAALEARGWQPLVGLRRRAGGGLEPGNPHLCGALGPAVLLYLGLAAIGWEKGWRLYFKTWLLAGLGGLAGAGLTLASFSR